MKYSPISLLILLIAVLCSCTKENGLQIPIPNDITLNELNLEPYTHVVPDGGFTSGGIHFNTKKHNSNSFSGFAYSNQNNRSFVWTDTKAAKDTNLLSVYTGARRNQTEVFAVGSAIDSTESYFTLESPKTIKSILFANTTYNYLAMNYGPNSGTPIVNPNIPSAPRELWYTYVPGFERRMNMIGDYYKVIATGYNGAAVTGKIDIYLLNRQSGQTSQFLLDWKAFDFTSLGNVSKVGFSTESSYKDENGKDLVPPFFCIDGIRFQEN